MEKIRSNSIPETNPGSSSKKVYLKGRRVSIRSWSTRLTKKVSLLLDSPKMGIAGVQLEGLLSGGEKKALLRINEEGLWKNSGSVLLSHPVTRTVPSALEGLTSVFGMETGVTPPLSPPKSKRMTISHLQ
jgi:hypothetical protein